MDNRQKAIKIMRALQLEWKLSRNCCDFGAELERAIAALESEVCETCEGSGKIPTKASAGFGQQNAIMQDCPDCQKPSVSPSELSKDIKELTAQLMLLASGDVTSVVLYEIDKDRAKHCLKLVDKIKGIIDIQAATIKSQFEEIRDLKKLLED